MRPWTGLALLRSHAPRGFAALGIVLAVAGGPAPGAAAAEEARRVLVLSVPYLTWADLDDPALENLRLLVADSAVASLSIRGVQRRPDLGDGYATVSAGTRSVAGGAEEGQCLGAAEPFEGAVARDVWARRVGASPAGPADDSVLCLGQAALRASNERLLYDAEVGALGEALDDAGVGRAVIGNADYLDAAGEVVQYRPAAVALTDARGLVPHGSVARELVEADPAGPFGRVASLDAVTAAFAAVWHDRTVVLVEASDLVRFELYRRHLTDRAETRMRAAMLARTDELVGRLLESVDPARDAVVLMSPAHPAGQAQLTVFALRAPGLEPGLLESAYTRRAGVVSMVDVAPTIVSLVDAERPGAMEGRPAEVERRGGDDRERRDFLVEMNERARFRDRLIAPVTTAFVVASILVPAGALVVVGRLRRRARAAVEVVALGLLCFLPLTYLAGLLPFHEWPAAAYWAFVFGGGLLAGAVVQALTRRDVVAALLVALGLVVGVIAADVVSGGRLQFNTVLGYSPTVAGRFAGIGNLAYSQLSAGALLLAGLVAFRVSGRAGARWGSLLLAAAVVVDGMPLWGADVGGVLSMVPSFGLAATLLLGFRPRLRAVLSWGAVTVVALGAFTLFDLTRPSERRTHLGRLVEQTTSGGWEALSTVILRKLFSNLAVLTTSVWTLMVPVALGLVGYLVYRAPGQLRGITRRIPPLRASLGGLLLLALLGFALNDSGISVPGMMVGVLTPVLVVLTAGRETIGEEQRRLGHDSRRDASRFVTETRMGERGA